MFNIRKWSMRSWIYIRQGKEANIISRSEIVNMFDKSKNLMFFKTVILRGF